MADIEDLRAAETRFQKAQLSSDLAELDLLLHPGLVFVGPDGTISDKAVDLAVHADGTLVLSALDPESLVLRVVDDVGVTVLTAAMEGSYAGHPFSARQRYTRTWVRDADGWRILAAHASVLSPDTP